MKRLVVAPNWVGDCVMAIPFLRALRASDPSGRLAVLSRASAAPVLRMTGLAEVLVASRGRGPGALLGDARLVGRARFDEVWVLPNSFRSALLARLAGAPKRFGYATDRRRFLLTQSPAKPAATRHQSRDYDRLLEEGGIAPDPNPPRLEVPPEAARKAAQYLDSYRIGEASRPIFLSPGAAFGATKRWPAERFALLADALMDEGHKLALTIGPDEIELGRLIARRARHRVPVMGADLDSGELAAVLAAGRLHVGNDSGPAHLAAAVGVPTVVFFGPTDPGRTAPEGAPVSVLDRYVFCSPCYLKVCPYRHECMEEISVEAALSAARQFLC
ncbi:MAG: lipopolysaccharide heptosyltransferase II [Thermoanaerobaculia bacterium]